MQYLAVLLTAILFAGKVFGYLVISWWLVFAPVIASIVATLIVVVVMLGLAAAANRS